MDTFSFGDKKYQVEAGDFLADYSTWDEDFARGMAPRIGIIGGLSEDHWKIIRFIRSSFESSRRCPLVYETCRANRLHLQELKTLFPSGYLRGACKLAGITYREGCFEQGWVEEFAEKITSPSQPKSYEIDLHGFLINPFEWDERFAEARAYEMKMPKLTDQHWQIIRFLRASFEKNNMVPNVYEACESADIDLEGLEKLFPDGYHRGAVKVAGLRVR
jgi:tRNA 2-thiouridine synthesizing protein E